MGNNFIKPQPVVDNVRITLCFGIKGSKCAVGEKGTRKETISGLPHE